MSDKKNGLIEELIIVVIGWPVCIAMLSGAFALGQWGAPIVGWSGNKDMFGLLSALALVWLYEHKSSQQKYDQLRGLLDRNSN